MGVNISIEYTGDLHCRAVHEPSGQALVTNAPVDNGGRGDAFSPTDMAAAALGACVMTIMGIAANRLNVDLTGMRAHIVKDMVSDPVRRIGRIAAEFTMPPGLAADVRARLEAAARACPVKQSLHPDVQIDWRFVYPD